MERSCSPMKYILFKRYSQDWNFQYVDQTKSQGQICWYTGKSGLEEHSCEIYKS
jgi:hypothetical protein